MSRKSTTPRQRSELLRHMAALDLEIGNRLIAPLPKDRTNVERLNVELKKLETKFLNSGHANSDLGSTEPTTEQLEAIARQLAPMVDHLKRLEKHMAEQGFEEADRLRNLVAKARNALEMANLELTTLTVEGFHFPPTI